MKTPVNINPSQITTTSQTAGCVYKYFVVPRTQTAFTDAIDVPAHLVPIHASAHSLGVVSDAGTSAVIQIAEKTSGTVLAQNDVKTSLASIVAVNVQPLLVKDRADAVFQAKIVETGTASTTGGPWLVALECMAVG